MARFHFPLKLPLLLGGTALAGILLAFWWAGSSSSRNSPDASATMNATGPEAKMRPQNGGDVTNRAEERGRSSNPRIRELADKLAKQVGLNPAELAAQLSDESLGPRGYYVGRDLIILFPAHAAELMEAFKLYCSASSFRNLKQLEVLSNQRPKIVTVPA